MTVSPEWLHKLDDALVERRTGEGFLLLEAAGDLPSQVRAEDPNAAAYLFSVAQWVDMGYGDLQLLERMLERFSSVHRAEMRLTGYLQLRMTEAFVALSVEDAAGAIAILEGVLAVQPGISRPHFALTAHYWKGRAHRQKGEYELAHRHILEAKNLALQLNAAKLSATIKVHESWILFQGGQRKEPFRLLDEAEVELTPTGHALTLGSIESARGRFVRRSGEYAKALRHFQRAIAIYSTQFPNHPNLARALVNAAYVKRLIALDLSHNAKGGRARGSQHDRYLHICREALGLLERAREIYALHRHLHGTGSVLVNAGHLHLDSADIERASEEAIGAFHLGAEKQDNILMARARVLQAAIENMRVEEQLGEPEDIARHANLATQYSEEAIALAQQTENKRLLAGAYIARGFTAANDFYEDWQAAKHFAAMASDFLSPDDRDHLSKELLLLNSRILRAIGIDETLRSWSDGLTGDKTFQQVTEEFADIVIPKVWMREERKISKVAEKLSISPKKVRRILRKAHLLR